MANGSCLCGKIRYQIRLDKDAPLETSACHCRPCRKITGATTSLNLTVPLADFTLVTGTPKTCTTRHCDEGFEFSLVFCGDCGSPIYGMPLGSPLPPVAIIQVGTLDDGGVLEATPVAELNVKHRLGWVRQVGGAAQKQGYIE
ncbi:glutathione-dependent formaldehyde-activating [Colletotrichum tofieldiae]|uniref:Glutathione-dependent formaldehyde-activating n=1 Tax=Colletotrichum tofieldiae TaxID=708197 RepID=A0A166VFZ2_9PEZI|nr:glutathione-dependent formaldehyde-activating [Colletotrichum tofieldiae]GKT65785.1 glutathione-dependent formaldehyde-activating [Colletotrichum tofieldiae]GKT71030.1 glutathione-dependent formaldehyde-activating [Colletotrichum tofieldiae]GKT94054.1 glutathione-dependent formaldehyde-activating [Colletotrichum tofieldiae]